MKPRVVDIGGIRWKIFWNKDCIDAKGICDSITQEIWLQKGLDEVTRKNVFIHELTHAMFYSYGFSPRKKEEFFEEDICNFIASGLSQIFAHNHHVAMYLAGGDDDENLSRQKLVVPTLCNEENESQRYS